MLKMVGCNGIRVFAFVAGASIAGYAPSVLAQAGPENSGTSLPPVTVESPKPRPATHHSTARANRATRSARRATSAGRGTETAPHVETAASKGTFQQGNGPIQGYVPHQTLVGTKTNPPILEVPQAISVVGVDQMRDQGAQTVVQALGYTAGVATNSDNATHIDRYRGIARRAAQ